MMLPHVPAMAERRGLRSSWTKRRRPGGRAALGHVHRARPLRLCWLAQSAACTAGAYVAFDRRSGGRPASLNGCPPFLEDLRARWRSMKRSCGIDTTLIGSGGQQLNKTDSAVRHHLPTGLVVSCQNERTNIRTRRRRCRYSSQELADGLATTAGRDDALSGDRGDNAWAIKFARSARPVPAGEDLRTLHETGNGGGGRWRPRCLMEAGCVPARERIGLIRRSGPPAQVWLTSSTTMTPTVMRTSRITR